MGDATTDWHGYGVNVCCPHESTGLCRNCRELSSVTVDLNRMLAEEVNRLRERVAALEAAGNAMREAAVNFDRGMVAAIARWDAALAQADGEAKT